MIFELGQTPETFFWSQTSVVGQPRPPLSFPSALALHFPKFNPVMSYWLGFFPPLPLISLEPWLVFLFTVLLCVCCHPRFASTFPMSRGAAAKIRLQPIPSQRSSWPIGGSVASPMLVVHPGKEHCAGPRPAPGSSSASVAWHRGWTSSKAWGSSPGYSRAPSPRHLPEMRGLRWCPSVPICSRESLNHEFRLDTLNCSQCLLTPALLGCRPPDGLQQHSHVWSPALCFYHFLLSVQYSSIHPKPCDQNGCRSHIWSRLDIQAVSYVSNLISNGL